MVEGLDSYLKEMCKKRKEEKLSGTWYGWWCDDLPLESNASGFHVTGYSDPEPFRYVKQSKEQKGLNYVGD